MKSRLFIRLSDDLQSLHWGLWDPENNLWIDRGDLLSVDLIALAEQSHKSETIVIAPATKLSQKTVLTPAKQLKQIQKAVPYMLEDQLASSVDQLHFAYGKRDKSGEIKVCWSTHRQMQHWRDWFEQAEVKVDALINELELFRAASDADEIILQDNYAIVLRSTGERWPCQRDLLPLLWQPTSEQTEAENTEELTIHPVRVFYAGELESFWRKQESVIAQPLQPEELLQTMAMNYNKSCVNLLQQQYAPRKESNLQLVKYRPVFIFASIALVMFLTMQGSRYYALSEEESVLYEQGRSLFNRVFSRQPRDGSLLGQVERVSKGQGSDDTQAEFIKLLSAMAEQLSSTEIIKPTSITFDGKKSELRVDILAPDYQTLNAFKADLQNVGLDVDMSSASAQGSSYSTRLVLRSKS